MVKFMVDRLVKPNLWMLKWKLTVDLQSSEYVTFEMATATP